MLPLLREAPPKVDTAAVAAAASAAGSRPESSRNPSRLPWEADGADCRPPRRLDAGGCRLPMPANVPAGPGRAPADPPLPAGAPSRL